MADNDPAPESNGSKVHTSAVEASPNAQSVSVSSEHVDIHMHGQPIPETVVVQEEPATGAPVVVQSSGGEIASPAQQWEDFKAVFKKDWWTPENIAFVRLEVFLGIIICFAQVPESVAFAYLANVEPPVALHAAWVVGLICSVFGGRPAMVNGATGAFAAIIKTFIDKKAAGDTDEGGNPDVVALFPSVICAGLMMMVVYQMKWYRFITMVPTTVMIGFCNGLAVVIGLSQLHPFTDTSCPEVDPAHADDHHDCDDNHGSTSLSAEWPIFRGYVKGMELFWMIVIMLSAMVTMEYMPKLPDKLFFPYLKLLPSSLCSIILAVVLEFCLIRQVGYKTKTIRDVSKFTKETSTPKFFFNDPLYDLDDLDTSSAGIFTIIRQGFLLCAVGVIESLMTQEVVNNLTSSVGDPKRTVGAMGVANIVSGMLGGMGGNAMIGLSTINGLNGGTGRLSPVVTALGIMCCVMGAYPVLNYIPVAALAGVMIVVVLHTFKWFSLKMFVCFFLPQSWREKIGLHMKTKRVDTAVIMAVTVVTIATNIAYAVILGVVISALAFAWNSGQTVSVQELPELGSETKKVYMVDGPLFFGSRLGFDKKFDIGPGGPSEVEIHLRNADISDYSGIDALNTVARRFGEEGKMVTFKYMDLGAAKMYIKSHQLSKHISIEGLSDADLEALPTWYSGWQAKDQVRQTERRQGINAAFENTDL